MKPLSRLEALLQDIVERPAGRLFPRKLHPLELAGALERAMENGAALLVDRIVAPNRFQLRLHPEDAERFESVRNALEAELVEHLTRFAVERDYHLVGAISVTVAPDEGARPGEPRVAAETREDEPQRSTPPEATQRIDPRRFLAGVRAGPPPASLTLLEHDRPVETFPISTRRFTVGRGDDNDAQVLDLRISRHHLQIDYEPPDFLVADLGSTNGTRLNNRRLDRRARLRNGDVLDLGGVRLVFRRA